MARPNPAVKFNQNIELTKLLDKLALGVRIIASLVPREDKTRLKPIKTIEKAKVPMALGPNIRAKTIAARSEKPASTILLPNELKNAFRTLVLMGFSRQSVWLMKRTKMKAVEGASSIALEFTHNRNT